MANQNTPITEIRGIGEKTANAVRKRISRRGNRITSGTVTVGDVVSSQTRAKIELDANQQRNIASETTAFSPSKRARNQSSARKEARDNQPSETINRGDYTIARNDFKAAREKFGNLSDEKQNEDRNSREPVTTNRELWEDNVDSLDFPGVDTPSTRRPRQQGNDFLFNDTTSQRRPRESWRESEPEQTEAQERLGQQPPTADSERTGIVRNENGTFISRPIEPDKSEGQYRSANGLYVGEEVQDPTIGRDPGTGEFEDRPLENEPTNDVPDPFDFFGGGSQSKSSSSDDLMDLDISEGGSSGNNSNSMFDF